MASFSRMTVLAVVATGSVSAGAAPPSDGAFDPVTETFLLNPISDDHCAMSVMAYSQSQLGGTKKPNSTISAERHNKWLCQPDADVPGRVACKNLDGGNRFEMTVLDKSLWPKNGLIYRSAAG